ncbi:erythromycin esterase family protein [Streptomyces cyaneofuscatus]|uniref:Erythromycin esterase family protein n=1 Tax=Streptomyces cyaneofuscatus TaxID=66883 RepID=A0ABZ1F065_9ACTN|nr:erythromycin esterase family protein [Streptomyces cyaneofuscatus]WSB09773.1 erythromycin esterase family protein [Streptomyces cyaneofuscatus]WSD46693.1 erythromycin esterase family protein [Streptomyces cyaneofuscatus]WTA90067.1 erythromycin esterase family protein [Streptomyces cyaneofuscatus]
MTMTPEHRTAVRNWIRSTAHPLTTADPSAPLDDLRPLLDMLGERTAVMGYGAGTRGAHELFALQVRVARLLVGEAGFRAVAFDQDWTLGVRLDTYVRTGAGDPVALLESAEPFCRTAEVLALVRWMRAFNEDHPRDPVRFVGVSPHGTGRSAYDTVAGYVQRAAPHLLDELESCYAALRPEGEVAAHTRRFRALPDRRSWRDRARAAHALVAGVPASDGHAWALHNARVIVQYHELHDHDDDPLDPHNMACYERFFAENVVWWHRHTGHRMLFWTSSSHSAKAPGRAISFPPDPASASPNAGSHLQDGLGDRYLSLGLTFGGGELATYAGTPPHRVPGPVPPLVESVLEDDVAGDYLLDLRTGAPPPVTDWLAGTAVSRAIGPHHDPDHDTAHHMTGGSLAEWFDVLVHRRHVTPARPLRR